MNVIYYDTGMGVRALICAAIRTGMLPNETLPTLNELITIIRDHARPDRMGMVTALQTDASGDRIFYVGLGESSPIVIRAWRNFLQMYNKPHSEYQFRKAPMITDWRFRYGERLIGRVEREWAARLLAKRLHRQYPSFLTLILCDWKGEG